VVEVVARAWVEAAKEVAVRVEVGTEVEEKAVAGKAVSLGAAGVVVTRVAGVKAVVAREAVVRAAESLVVGTAGREAVGVEVRAVA
jgi:hypothetical protein